MSERARGPRVGPLSPTIVTLALLAGASLAQAEDPVPEPEPKIVLHGYLSQAYAISRDHQLLGIPTAGTADYRTAALQFRAALTPRDTLVIQFSQERLGRSPVMKVKNEVDLDWVFYERQLGESLYARAGKVKIPLGIYNELRFVGPLLPFFRPTSVFYGEGSYTTETINGVVVSKELGREVSWHADVDAYFGEWSFLQEDSATRARMNNTLGGQVWIHTPLQGLRFGIGGYRSTATNLLNFPAGHRETRHEWHASGDGNFARFRVSAEYARKYLDAGSFETHYAQAGVRITGKLTVNLQVARSHLRFSVPGASFDRDLERDYALGINYAFRPDVLVKLEHHWNKGQTVELERDAFFGPALRTRYAILSISTFF